MRAVGGFLDRVGNQTLTTHEKWACNGASLNRCAGTALISRKKVHANKGVQLHFL